MFRDRLSVFLVFVLMTIKSQVHSESVFPASPCPSTFNYEYDNNHEPRGVMVFRNDMSGRYKVEVNITIPALTTQNFHIKRVTPRPQVQNGDNIVYNLIFPRASAIPFITKIMFNDNVYCSFTPNMEGSFSLTSLYAYDFFSVTITSKNTNVKPVSPLFPTTAFYDTQQTTASFPSSIPPLETASSPPSIVSTFSTEKPTPTLENQLTTLTKVWMAIMMAQSLSTGGTTQKPATTLSMGASGGGGGGGSTTLSTKPPETSTIKITTIIHNRHFEVDDEECGIGESTQPLIVHGLPTSEGQFPWLTAMFHIQDDEYKFKCAANLISQKHVVTAAHCVRFEKTIVSKENIILVLGKHNIRQWAIRSEIRDVKKVYIHPDYSQPSDADIAVLIMKTPVEYSSSIKPVCLWIEDGSVETIVGSEGTVVGWGRDEEDNAYVPEPKQLSMPVISQEDCLRSDFRFLKLTSRRTFCAGTRKGAGACTGDSGGGFLMKRSGKWILRGIVSSALTDPQTRSCDVNNYMVFADVSKYMPWIKEVMSK